MKKEKKYCEDCGRRLVVTYENGNTYDPYTGNRFIQKIQKCEVYDKVEVERSKAIERATWQTYVPRNCHHIYIELVTKKK